MSIVGTRPPLISETNLYEPRHKARLAIKPGRIRCSTGIACICVTVLLILGRRIVVRIKPWMLITIVLGITAVMIFSNVLFNNPMIQYFVVNVLHRSGMMTGRVEIYNTFLKIMRTDIWLGAGYDNTIVMQNTTLLVSGRLIYRKGIELLLDSVNHIETSRPWGIYSVG